MKHVETQIEQFMKAVLLHCNVHVVSGIQDDRKLLLDGNVPPPTANEQTANKRTVQLSHKFIENSAVETSKSSVETFVMSRHLAFAPSGLALTVLTSQVVIRC